MTKIWFVELHFFDVILGKLLPRNQILTNTQNKKGEYFSFHIKGGRPHFTLLSARLREPRAYEDGQLLCRYFKIVASLLYNYLKRMTIILKLFYYCLK